MSDKYDFKASELKWLNYWESNDLYKFDEKSNRKVYSVDTPPPYKSGTIHMGHALSYSHQDFVIRYRRMAGYNVYYPWGTDDNGLPTERYVEKKYKIKSKDMPRAEFIALCKKEIDEMDEPFTYGWRRLGISANFKDSYSTIDEWCRKTSQRSFIDLYKKGLLYRKEAPTMWCVEDQAALAQADLEDEEMSSTFNDIVFKSGGKDLVVATTRPELLPACVALFYNPEDDRYKKLKGKFATVPLFNFEVPILEDEKADPTKGTGLVMCCTFGDQTDIEWWKKHNLPLKTALTPDGKMTELAGKYAGLRIKAARKEIINDLTEAKLLVAQKAITHAVNVHERCKTEIEFLNTKQWYIRLLDRKEDFIDAADKIKWHPEWMKKRYEHWVQNLQWDWAISRQRHYGVPIPVWYCKQCGEVMLPDDKDLPVDPTEDMPKKKCECGSNDFEGEKDVLDTWATSSMTPQIISRWKEDNNFYNKTYPNDLRPQAHDIIRTWAFYTIVKSLYHENSIPWKNIMVSGYLLASSGEKMSKSKGNVISPLDIIDKYGADATRFWTAGAKLGVDMPFMEKDLVTGQKTVTKLWNAAKFAFMQLEDYKGNGGNINYIDRWMLTKLNKLIKEVTESFENYEYSKAKNDVDQFFWHTLCDNYLEIIKDRMYNPQNYEEGKTGAQYVLNKSVLSILKMFAPIMPFITEDVYQMNFAKQEGKKSIHVSDWPAFMKEELDYDAEKAGDLAVEIISAVRKYKSEKNVSLKQGIKKLTLEVKTPKLLDLLIQDIKATTRAEEIEFGAGDIQVSNDLAISVLLDDKKP